MNWRNLYKSACLNSVDPTARYAKYRYDPEGYARDVLKVSWWSKQVEIANALCRPPYRVLVKASHSIGKSMAAGGLVNWWYDTRKPGVCLTTAPTARQVRDVLWKEVRRQRAGRAGFPGPKIPRLEDAPDHFAHGFTAQDATAFQGQHELAVFLIFDEAVGVGREFWESAETMCQGHEYAWLAIFNPTDTTSQAYREEDTGKWTVIDIPATEHPNIHAELAGLPPLYPSAIRLAWLEEKLDQWCDPVNGDPLPTDIEWPPGSGNWGRPSPLAQARLLARWPTQTAGVWGDALWTASETAEIDIPDNALPEIGCDVARFGDDDTAAHVRAGPCSLHHESANGWDTAQTAGRLKQLAIEWCKWANSRRDPKAEKLNPQQIKIKVDDDGVGGGVVDQLRGWNVQAVNAGTSPRIIDDYPNARSELWFNLVDLAKRRRFSLAAIPKEVRRKLKAEATAPKYKLNAAGQRVVETKEELKKADRLGRSPDNMDAVNLAYYDPCGIPVATWIETAPAARIGQPQAPAREPETGERIEPEETGIRLWGR